MTLTQFLSVAALLLAQTVTQAAPMASPRERVSLDAGWCFHKGDDPAMGTNLTLSAISQWDLPTANPFTTNAPLTRPADGPAGNLSFTRAGFDDNQWRLLNLSHDWGIRRNEFSFDPDKFAIHLQACSDGQRHMVLWMRNVWNES